MKTAITGTLILLLSTLCISTSLAQPFLSDDFNCAELNSVWNFVNPLSDGGWALVGAGSGDAHLSLTLPPGTTHDAWGPGGVNQAVRMMQAADDVDFKIEVKFNTEPAAGFNDQGIVVEQDSDNWIRFDVYSPASGPKVFVGRTVGGTNSSLLNSAIASGSAQYLLLERSGDTWTASISADGVSYTVATSFSLPLAITEVGVYAANPVDGLAWTSEVDWFFEQDNPLSPEDPVNDDSCDHAIGTETSTWGSVKARF